MQAALWKAENKPQKVIGVNQMSEVIVRKLWAGEKVVISAGNAKLVNRRGLERRGFRRIYT